jgi:hypothetical protein
MNGAIRLLPRYDFMAWCSVKTQGQLYICEVILCVVCCVYTKIRYQLKMPEANNRIICYFNLSFQQILGRFFLYYTNIPLYLITL